MTIRGKSAGIIAAAILVAAAYWGWTYFFKEDPDQGLISGNGRIEATEIDIAAKLAGRIERILVDEGDFVRRGDVLAIMQTDTLVAQLREAQAQYMQARTSEASARAQIVQRESDRTAAEAVAAQRRSELDQAQRRLARSANLSRQNAISRQDFDDDETKMHGTRAALAAAEAQVAVADAAIRTAMAEAEGAKAMIAAAEATVARIQADIDDSTLTAPRSGRIQYRIAHEGEVLPAGGKLLNLVDLADVYMTFFLPEQAVGRVAIGSEVRLVLDAAPQYVIPARASYVSSTAQFTPKTVETQVERQKLMFRVKARIEPALLEKHIRQVKTGLPGVAWVQIEPDAAWPKRLALSDGHSAAAAGAGMETGEETSREAP